MDLEDLAIFLDRDSFIEGFVHQVKNERPNQAGGAVRRAMYFSSVTGDKGLHEIAVYCHPAYLTSMQSTS